MNGKTWSAWGQRNANLYLWYATAFQSMFWLPVFFLYFSSKFTIAQVLQLEAVYYACVVLIEVPSGYYSDRFGRRPTLLIAAGLHIIAHSLFWMGQTYEAFLFAQMFLAAGFAFNSGTDLSFHYDSLHIAGKLDEFPDREAKVTRNTFLASGLAAVIGGFAASQDMRNAYALSMGAAAVAFYLMWQCKEPLTKSSSHHLANPWIQVRLCLRQFRKPAVLWLGAFAIAMIAMNHIPYEFYQPYIQSVLRGEFDWKGQATSTTGLHTAATMLVAAVFAAWSIRWSRRVGVRMALLSAACLQTILIVMMASVLHWGIVLLLLLRSSPRALMTAPMNAAIAPLIHSRIRATFLSLVALFGRLLFAGILWALSFVAMDTTGEPALFASLHVSMWVAIALLSGLIISSPLLRVQQKTI